MRRLMAVAFDGWRNLVFCVEELGRQIQYAIDDAMDAWGDDDEEA